MRHRRLAASAVLVASLLLPSGAAAASPIAGNDQAATNEDTPVTIDLLRNDSDPDGDPLHIQSIIQGLNGKVALAPVEGLVSFAPNLNFNGPATFSYVVADAGGATATGLVTVFVNPVNDPPRAFDRFATVAEDGSVAIVFQALDPDKEGCDLIFTTELRTGHGSLTPLVDAGCSPNGDMASSVYTPDPNYNGPDSISYVVSDGTVQSNFATASFTIIPVDDAPVALAGSASTTSGVPVTITLRGYDWETCELTFALITTTPHGKLTPIPPQPQLCGPGGPFVQNVDSVTLVYTPEPTFSGTDTLTFAVSDGTTLSAPAPFSITVVGPPAVHVGDLDRAAIKGSGTWQASATVRIDTAGHAPQPGALVRGVWTSGLAGSCTTTVAGTCSTGSGAIPRSVKSATFTVTSVAVGSAIYDPSANHDPDGDSNGTSIAISRP